jgi:DNA-binding transcriptional MerR regulator
MQIGELSARTGASVRMLRYYEEQGLLEPERTESGYRVYRESDVLRVGHVRCMLASALPTSVVREAVRFLLDGAPPVPVDRAERERLAERLQTELDSLTERIEILHRSRDSLARFVDDVRRDQVGPDHLLPVAHDVGPAVRQGAPMARARRTTTASTAGHASSGN